ncbi:MAG: fibronectin type III domain-containing protein [Candidatus Coatesbacteria bacterium]
MLSAGAPARADLIINSFEPTGTPYTAWTSPPTTCARSLTCGATGPCVTLFRDTTIGQEGTASGVVWLQEDLVFDPNTDCVSNLCDGLHPVTIQTFAPKDWSTGYLKVVVSGSLPKPGVSVDMGLRVKDTDGHTAYGPLVTLSTAGSWVDAPAVLGDLASQGLTLSKIDQVAVIFSSVSACTSVLIDSLRLTVGTPPCAPNAVSAFPGDTAITLNWQYPLVCPGTYPVAQYCLYRATSALPGPVSSPMPVPLPAGITRVCGVGSPYNDKGLDNGTTYFYKVAAIDTDGNEGPPGDVLPEQDFATPTCGGTAPSCSAASWASGIRIMWSPVAGATAFRIYRAPSAGSCAAKGVLLSTQPGVSVYWDDTAVVLSQNYCYTVTAVVGGCEGPCSNQACVTYVGGGAPPCSPPGPILSLSALPRPTQVLLTWTEPAAGDAPISYYNVFRSLSPGGSQTLAWKEFDTGAPVYTWTNTALPPVTQYCYEVVAIAANLCSSTSTEECVTTGCDLSPPFNLSSVGWCDRVRLSWSGVPASTYKICRAPAGGACGAIQLDVMPGVSVYYDDMTAAPGTVYAYVVTASGALCDSACSTEVTATSNLTDPCPPTPPCTPPGVVATPTGTTGTGHLTVAWPRPVVGGSPLSKYFVWLGAGSTGTLAGKVVTATVWDSDGGPTFTVTITGLTVDSTYCAIIEVADDGLPSCTNFSAEACFTTACVTPPPPGTLGLAARPPSSLLVSWAPSTGGEIPISRYLVYRATAAGGAQSLSGTSWEAGGLNLSFTATGVALTQDCWYQVMAVDEQGCTTWSAGPPSGFHGCTPPGLITTVGVNARAPSSLLVSWAPPTPGEPGVGLSRYYVYRSTGAGYAQTISGTVYDAGPLAALTMTVTGLNLTQEYCFQVMAIDQAGCTIWSDPPPTTGCRVCTPPTPVGPTALSGLPPNTMTLGWTRPAAGDTPVSRYLIFRSTASGAQQAYFGTVYDDGVNTAYTFTNSGAATTGSWCYQVLTVDQGGCSNVSGDFCYSCAPPQWGIAHDGTANMSAAKMNSTDVWVSWDFALPGDTMNRAVTWNPVSKYFVYRSTGSSCYVQQVCATLWDDQVALSFAVTVTGLSPDTAYSFEIMAVSRNGCATLSLDCGLARTSVCQPQWLGVLPPCPVAFANIVATTQISTTVLVTWDFAPPGDTVNRTTTANPVSRYFVYRTKGSTCDLENPSGTIWDDQVSLSFSLTVGGLEPATQYRFEIIAVSEDGCSTRACDCATANTNGACSFTKALSAWAVTGPTGTPAVGLQWGWTSTGTVVGFDILRGDSSSGGSGGKAVIGSAPPGALTWTDSGVQPGKSYFYVIELHATQPLGLSDCTVTSTEVGVSLPALKLAVFPNPAQPAKTPVRFDGLPAGSVVELYTLNGELVRKSPTGTGALWLWDGKNDNGTMVSAGIYLWIVRTEGKVTRGKLVVGQ